jgi:hypothetical protein
MALHRDIYWVGRQWAVTGYGIQAIDRKLKGKFDIGASRVWKEGLLENMREKRGSQPGFRQSAFRCSREKQIAGI